MDFPRVFGRSLREVIFQVVEENPEPVPGEAFSESGVPPPAGTTWAAVLPSSGGSATVGDGFEYSSAAIEELASLVARLGARKKAIGYGVYILHV